MEFRIQDSMGNFEWVDVVDPTEMRLEELSKTYGIPSDVIVGCLEPDHQPRWQRVGKWHYLVLRAHDKEAPKDADTVQELTRKICIFYTDDVMLTIHRRDQRFLERLRAEWALRLRGSAQPQASASLLSEIFDGTFLTFEDPIAESLESLDRFEMSVFGAPGAERFNLKKGYFLRRRAYVYRRTLRLSLDMMSRFIPELPPGARDVVGGTRISAEALFAHVDELEDHVNSLLGLHLSILSNNMSESSHTTNEVMRVLTVISVCFMPLNLIAGIYGMNFRHMPELERAWGYPVALASMGVVALVILLWFWRRGWLRKAPRLSRR